MNRSILSPIYLLPLSLVSPYIFGGVYGVTVAELLMLLAFFAFAVPELISGSFKIPRFLFVYLVLLTAGWLGALINGLSWNIPIGLGNVTFFYKIVLALGAYYVGFRSCQTMERVVTHRFFKVVIIGLAVVAALYPFMSYDQRFALLRFFYAGDEGDIARLHAARFPGLGINANIYSFMAFMLLVFAFDAYVRRRLSALYPLLAFIAIVSAASKLVISVSVVACLLIVFNQLAPTRVPRAHGPAALIVSSRALTVSVVLVLFGAGAFLFLTQSALGRQIVDGLETFRRFSEALEGGEGVSSFGDRFFLWSLGLERVALAPMWGITPDRSFVDDNITLRFANPHNEFIELWMFFGLMGVLAHVLLLGFLVTINLRRQGSFVWLLMYAGLIAHMLFDAAFSYVRFCGMFFMMVGMNVYALKASRTAHVVPSASPSPA